MSVDEAILQMNLLDHQFYFFRNADNDNIHAVVYKRAAGGYGSDRGRGVKSASTVKKLHYIGTGGVLPPVLFG